MQDLESQPYQQPSQQMDSIDLANKEDKVDDALLKLNPRLGFIKKVYGILTFQLVITILLCMVSMLIPSFAHFQQNNPAVMITSAVLSLILVLGLLCYTKCSRRVPFNYIILTLFTLCEAYMVSSICSLSDPENVILAAVMTLGVTVSLTLYACTTKTDFTYFAGFLFVSVSSLMMWFFFLFFFDFGFLYVSLCMVGVIIYGMYLVYDTQLILGGKHNELGYDDYIIGAVLIYLDIVVLFVRILEIMNALKK